MPVVDRLPEQDAHAGAKKTKRTGADERLRAAMKCALDALLAAELSFRALLTEYRCSTAQSAGTVRPF